MKRIAILGSTGSIGRSTLSVAEAYPERFQIVALAAGSNLDAAFEQAIRWRPRVVSMALEADADALRTRLKTNDLNGIEIVHGATGTVRVAAHHHRLRHFDEQRLRGHRGVQAFSPAADKG